MRQVDRRQVVEKREARHRLIGGMRIVRIPFGCLERNPKGFASKLTFLQIHCSDVFESEARPSAPYPPRKPGRPTGEAVHSSTDALDFMYRRLVAENSHAQPTGPSDARQN